MTQPPQGLVQITRDVFCATEPVQILGMPLTATMTALRLANGGLLLYSPISASASLSEAVQTLGSVAHLYAPNTFHHLHIAEWARRYPDATLHAPAGLANKRKDLTPDRFHGAGTPAGFEREIDEIAIEGFRLEESVLYHRASRTLLVADLLHHIGRPAGAWTRLYTKAMGFYDRVALSRMIRFTGFTDRKAARRSVDRILSLPLDRIVVGHGRVIDRDPTDQLRDAMRWLPAS